MGVTGPDEEREDDDEELTFRLRRSDALRNERRCHRAIRMVSAMMFRDPGASAEWEDVRNLLVAYHTGLIAGLTLEDTRDA